MRVLVTGAAGQLGQATAEWFGQREPVIACTRADLDITDRAAVERVINAEQPDVVINCAAYNDVDGAEDNAPAALAHNALAVLYLATAADEAGAVFIHYSTDFVFDGIGDRPYIETDAANPQSTYGLSKLLGEWLAKTAARHYVLRVESLFGGPRARSSIDKILESIHTQAPARVFVDRTVTPSYVFDVVAATAQLIERNVPAGLYHCVNSGAATWLEVAEEAQRLLGRETQLVPVRCADVTLRAKRPQYCALSNEKLRAAGISMPGWQDALARHVAASQR